MTSKPESLLPCAHCGSATAPRLTMDPARNWINKLTGAEEYTQDEWQVVCDASRLESPGCGASSGYSQSPERAIAKWNRRSAPETPAPQSEANADLSELKRLAAHYGGYAEKIMRAAANEIEQRRVEVEKYKAWAASCDPTPPDAKPDAWMSSINPDLVTSDENEVLCWNNPPIPLYRRAEKTGCSE